MKRTVTGKIAVRLQSAILGEGIVSILRKAPGLIVSESDGSVSSLVTFEPDIVIMEAVDCDFIAVVRENSNAIILPVLTAMLPEKSLAGFSETLSLYESEEAILKKISLLLGSKESSREEKGNDELSPREREVVLGIVKGLSNKEIASEMNVSVNTVMTHRRNIASKLQIHSPAGLTIYAITTGIVDIEDIKNSAFL